MKQTGLISKDSKKLIAKVSSLIDDPILQDWDAYPNRLVKTETLVNWLKKTTYHDKKTRYLLESLRACLLKDLHDSFESNHDNTHSKQTKTVKTSKLKFQLLATAGTLLSICAGFNGITAILALTTAPIHLIVAAGVVFSIIYVVFYLSSDLIELSKTTGVILGRSPHVVDVLLQQAEQLDKLRKIIDKRYIEMSNAGELLALHAITEMLTIRYMDFDDVRKECETAIKSPYLKSAEILITGVKSILIFAGGYFAGQTVALAVGGLFVASLSAVSWPVIVASIIVGLSAFGVYCVVQHAEFENRVGRLVGLDKEKIKKLVEDSGKPLQKLQLLQRKITHELQTQQQIEALKQQPKFKHEGTIDLSSQPTSVDLFTTVHKTTKTPVALAESPLFFRHSNQNTCEKATQTMSEITENVSVFTGNL